MPSKATIFEHWMNWLSVKGIDWGEPQCWACGVFWNGKYDINNPGASRLDIINNWNKVPLQRCHIIPKQFGGTDEPSNLFLMCIDCHDKAPNTRSTEAFLIWAQNQSWLTNMYNEMMREIEVYQLQDQLEEMTKLISDKETRKQIFHDISLHWDQKGRGCKVTISTPIAAIYNYMQTHKPNTPI